MKTNYSLQTLTIALLVSIFTIQLHAQIIADGDYLLINAVNNEAMTAPSTFADNSPNPDFFAYMTAINASDDNQIFTFSHLGNDVYTIVNKATTNYIGIKDNWCGDFGNVQGRFQQTDTNIEFKIVPAAVADTFTIEIAFTQCNFGSVNEPIKAFDIDGGNIGARINTFPKDPMNANQQWQIVSPNILNVTSFESKQDNVLSIFPIPADQYLDLQLAKNLGNNISIQLNNIHGQLMLSKNIQNNQLASRLDVAALAPGFYFLTISDSSKISIATRKIMIN